MLGLRAWERLADPHTPHLPAPCTETAGELFPCSIPSPSVIYCCREAVLVEVA